MNLMVLKGKFDCHVRDINAALGLELDKYATDEEFEPHLKKLQAYLLKHSGFSSKFGDHKVVFYRRTYPHSHLKRLFLEPSVLSR